GVSSYAGALTSFDTHVAMGDFTGGFAVVDAAELHVFESFDKIHWRLLHDVEILERTANSPREEYITLMVRVDHRCVQLVEMVQELTVDITTSNDPCTFSSQRVSAFERHLDRAHERDIREVHVLIRADGVERGSGQHDILTISQRTLEGSECRVSHDTRT